MATDQQQPQAQGIGVAGKLGVVALVAGLVFGSPAVLDHLEQWESGGETVLVVYQDRLANGLPTVCDGLTRHVTATPIVVGETWTRAKCRAEQAAALAIIQHRLLACFRGTPPQSVFDMATSHAWNFGVGATCNSMAMQAWRQEQWAAGCRRLQLHDDGRPAWSYAGGKFVRGLANRRADERLKCMKGW